ncbi:TetR/AcrR family transcriptional regulator [Nocardia niwae]|uniref:Helix-turn-helix domain-containing protein n=1 Tax=Nocardia niwae TaxID=626084 RepID=A0ABV2XJP6_9NOCA|nr:TetR/AcrR family transcriptional regulator [Nocardia niwae]
MSRTKEFDPDVALDRALQLFWERGYESTSMADLTEHLGIARASIYATFGSKHELFTKALQRYLEAADAQITADLSRPGPALPAIRALVDRFTDEACAPDRFMGCMVSNAAVELAARDATVGRLVESSWARMETALAAALTRARAQDELAPDAEPRAIARFLLVFIQGLRVLERVPGTGTRLRDASRVTSTILR